MPELIHTFQTGGMAGTVGDTYYTGFPLLSLDRLTSVGVYVLLVEQKFREAYIEQLLIKYQ